jgi:xanthine dehydrogenase accessory factor
VRGHTIIAMIFSDLPTVIRGGGDLATGVAYRLWRAGFPIVVLELPTPLAVRRRVALSSAIPEGAITIDEMTGRRVGDLAEAWNVARQGQVAVLVSAELPAWAAESPSVLVDARMAKRNLDTSLGQAPLVIALGPGFTAGVDCHAVIETERGHDLGRVQWHGSARPNTGVPGRVGGEDAARVLRAPADGPAVWRRDIGQRVAAGELLGSVAGRPIFAPFDGVIRGLIAPGTAVWHGLKIGDLDPRADPAASTTISDKALAVGGGVLEAVLTWVNGGR